MRETAWNVVESVERAWSVVPVVGATLAEGSSVDSAQQRQSRLPRTTTQHPSETRSGKARGQTHRTLVMVTVPACFVSSRQCDERSRWSSRYVRPYVCVGRSRHSNRRRLVVLSSLLLRRVSQNSLLLSARSLHVQRRPRAATNGGGPPPRVHAAAGSPAQEALSAASEKENSTPQGTEPQPAAQGASGLVGSAAGALSRCVSIAVDQRIIRSEPPLGRDSTAPTRTQYHDSGIRRFLLVARTDRHLSRDQ